MLRARFVIVFTVFLNLASTVIDLPIQELIKSYAPNVSPWSGRSAEVHLSLTLNVTVRRGKLDDMNEYEFWNYDNQVPGPFIRARVGDWLDVEIINLTPMTHGIDFHAVTGPGGGEMLLLTSPNSTRRAGFKMLKAGLYIYHCATAPVAIHVSNGLYGLIMVEPSEPLPPVDKEFYIVRSEFYTEPTVIGNNLLQQSYRNGENESPEYVVFNGRKNALRLTANINDRIRIYFGNAGPNQVSSLHVVGVIFDRIYREGDLLSSPARNIQTTLIPAGGTVVVDFQVLMPGNYSIVDHSIYRLLKGALGVLTVPEGTPRSDIYCTYNELTDSSIYPSCQSSAGYPAVTDKGGGQEITEIPTVRSTNDTTIKSKENSVKNIGFLFIFVAVCFAYIYRSYDRE